MSAIASKEANTNNSSIIHDSSSTFFRNVVRQHWEGKLASLDKAKSKHVAAEIDNHLANMNPLVDKLDYEIFCVPNIIAHSKHISKDEFRDYLKLLESMALGYSSTLGRDLTSLVLIGLTSKARNPASAEKYFKALSSDVQSKVYRYESAITRKRKKVYGLSRVLQKEQKGILRFLRRRRISAVNKRIEYRIKEIEGLNLKLQTFMNVSAGMKEKTVAAKPPQPQPSSSVPPSALPPRKD